MFVLGFYSAVLVTNVVFVDRLWKRENTECALIRLSRNDVTLALLNKADTLPPPDQFSSLFG